MENLAMQKLDTQLRKEIKISNVVCTADLKQKVDLTTFNKYPHLSAKLGLYYCGYVKDDEMIGRVTVFHTGKLISVGTKTIEQAELELEKTKSILKKYHLIKNCKITPKVQNIASSTTLKKKVDLVSFARGVPKSLYEPDQFPGIIHRVYGSIVDLIFSSGKVIIVGSKSYEELNEAYFYLSKTVENYYN